MKNISYSHALLLFFSLIIVSKSTKAQFGFYLTKEDYLKKKITVVEKMQLSENVLRLDAVADLKSKTVLTD